MADTKDAAKTLPQTPTTDDIERVHAFVREPFLIEGETLAALVPGSPRRRALDAALVELDAGAEHPSIEWRRDYSLLLGLERVLADERPQLADGADLNEHQVDALSGTLAALISEIEGGPAKVEINGEHALDAIEPAYLKEREADTDRSAGKERAPRKPDWTDEPEGEATTATTLDRSPSPAELADYDEDGDEDDLDLEDEGDEPDDDLDLDLDDEDDSLEDDDPDDVDDDSLEDDLDDDEDDSLEDDLDDDDDDLLVDEGGDDTLDDDDLDFEDDDDPDDEVDDDETNASVVGDDALDGDDPDADEVEDEVEAALDDPEPDDSSDAAGDHEPKDWDEPDEDEEVVVEAPEDPGASRRFWFEHATGAGKTVAAVGFIEASRTGGILILTHRRNLVDQFIGEISDRGYSERLSPALLDGADHPYGPVTVETYQWFVRNATRVSDAYSIVICDEAHTALGEKTSACIRAWQGPVYIGMTATGALIARHVADLFPTQTSRFDLAQAARRGVIAPLRCIRIPPGPGVRTIAKVPLRKGEVDQDFDQEELAKLLDQAPFNVAIADLYRSRFRKVPGVLYTAGVRHAKNVAAALQDAGINARAVSGETPKRELAEILAGFERGEVDVLCNAMLLAEGWNSPRATICMHLAPTASRRVYQQRVGRVTRRNPGKEAGLVIDFVHPATTHDETIVTLHSLLDRDVYRGGAIVVGPVRRGRGRRVRVERRVVPVSDDPERRIQVLERELWRVAVENLNHTEQHVWSALAGARVNPASWRRAKAMLQHDEARELRRRFLVTCVQRNRNQQLRLKALAEISALRDPDAFDDAVEVVSSWSREDRYAGTRVLLEALAERRIGRRDQAQAWVWRLAENTRDLHEEYAVQRWPETKRLLGLLVNSSGRAHGRNARRLVHAARNHDRRLAVALLAAAVAHTPEGEEVLRGARMRAARKPSAVARELLRNFPKSGTRRRRRRRRSSENGSSGNGAAAAAKPASSDNGATGERAPARRS